MQKRSVFQKGASWAATRLSRYITNDELYLRLKFWGVLGRKLDLEHPVTFNEKLQWLKLHDRSPEYVKLVDKYAVKDYVAEIIGPEHIIPTIGVWERFEDIDFEKLPDRFVLKCTHDSGGLVICRDKSKLDLEAARKKINRCLENDYYLEGREWQYKNVPRRIIAEQYMEDQTDGEHRSDATLTDYKVFCFDGIPEVIMTVRGGHEDENMIVRRMYDPDWKLFEVGLHGKPPVHEAEERPGKLEEMLQYARKLSKGFRHIRVDFYVIGNRVYFGELTFYHMTGLELFDPVSFDRFLGDKIRLE